MKRTLFIILLLLPTALFAQKNGQARIDSLMAALPKIQEDTNKVNILNGIGWEMYLASNFDSAISYGSNTLRFAQKLGFQNGQALSYAIVGGSYLSKGNYSEALKNYIPALECSKAADNKDYIANMYMAIGIVYGYQANYSEALKNYFSALKINDETDNKGKIAATCTRIGNIYESQGNYPKALEYDLKALKIDEDGGNKNGIADIIGDIGNVYCDQGDYSTALEYDLRALKIEEEIGSKQGISRNTGNIGNVYFYQGNYPKALEYHLKALKTDEEIGNKAGIGSNISTIGVIYQNMENFPRALEYYTRSLKTYEELGDKSGIATNTSNIGDIYFSQNNDSGASEYYRKALKMFEEMEDNQGISYANNGIAYVYEHQGNYVKALEYHQKALKMSGEMGAKQNTASAIGAIGSCYLSMASDTTADPLNKQQWLRQSIIQLEAATQQTMAIGDLNRYQIYAKSLSDAYALNKQYDKALTAFQEHSKYKDSVFGEEKKKEFTRREMDYEYGKREDSIKLESEKKELSLQKEIQLNALRYEYEKKQALAKTEKERQQLHFEEELKRQQIEDNYKQKQAAIVAAQQQKELQRKAAQDKKDALAVAEMHRQQNMVNASLAGSALLLIAALSSGYAYRQKKKDNRIIADEKQRSEDLLLNILPAEVAEELKEKGSAAAKYFDSVSVLFTDFVNFTGVAEHLSPTQLVQELHECFTAFDAIIERNGLEKIKTIGDAYMAVCGLPVADPNHAKKTVQAALEMRNFINERKKKENVFEIRIGVNSGPVVAGIVGVKKFAYDIWGDTVNTAARMEQHSQAGKVNISQATYELVKNDFSFEPRGKVAAKNKGDVEMYFAEDKIYVS